MMSLPDIKSQKDIQVIIDYFYEQVKKDKLLSPYFIKVNWEKHLPIMYKFWSNVVFYDGQYEGNPMIKHQLLNQKNPISKKHFNRWLTLFTKSITQFYDGPRTTLLKSRAIGMSNAMLANISA